METNSYLSGLNDKALLREIARNAENPSLQRDACRLLICRMFGKGAIKGKSDDSLDGVVDKIKKSCADPLFSVNAAKKMLKKEL